MSIKIGWYSKYNRAININETVIYLGSIRLIRQPIEIWNDRMVNVHRLVWIWNDSIIDMLYN